MLTSKTVEQIAKRLEKMEAWRFACAGTVTLEAACTMEHYRTPPDNLTYSPAPAGSVWGEHWGTVWFRGTVEVSKELRGTALFYRHRFGGERLLYVNGVPAGGMDPNHNEVLLTAKAKGGEVFTLYVESYCGHPVWEADPYSIRIATMHSIPWVVKEPPPLPLLESALVHLREDVDAFLFDTDVLYRTALLLDTNSARRAAILETLRTALDGISLQWTTEEELSASVSAAHKIIAPLLKSRNSATIPSVGITGHAHIDVGWLWPVKESIRKCARTFSTVLALMEQYPEFTFVQSQAVLYEMVERHYPELLTRIKRRVKEGRWEPNGAMWVEADCNVSGGEALVRQLLEGRKKFQELFGYRGDTLWLPDVFGYSAALPQILSKSGIVNFVTSKINWNDTNRFPYDTFWWRGIDGSEIFTAFITTRTNGYNADVTPQAMQEAWDFVQQKELQDSVLASVGWGDGGGGPTREMCERARRMSDLEGCNRTTFTNVSPFLRKLREQNVVRPRWCGELYLEFHRGTYTTQARIKRWNRKLEFLLRDVEIFAVMAMLDGCPYPHSQIEEQWRVLLTNQFHDILPGSSIREVYQVAEEQYRKMDSALGRLLISALNSISRSFPEDSDGQAWLVANSLATPREEVLQLPVSGFNTVIDNDGVPLPVQKTRNGIAVKVSMAPLNIRTVALRNRERVARSPFAYTGIFLETPLYKMEFDKAGRIVSLLDKHAGREIVKPGRWLNAFYTAEDRPIYWDAWDIDRFYRDTVRFEERLRRREVMEDGPLFMVIRSEYSIGRSSTLKQDLVVYADNRRIDFRTEVDWGEKHTLLKAGFALDICADTWRNEIQFGHTVRNLHSNTSWDQARFEVCAHKWVDVSEGGYGVALLNDCKYGHDAMDDMISLTLLRSPWAPDPEADAGVHHFAYALLPHADDFQAATVVREAYRFNVPLHCVKMTTSTSGDPAGFSAVAGGFCRVSEPNIIVEAIKKAEEDEAVIIRLYESGKIRTNVTVYFALPLKRAAECNLMEEEEKVLSCGENNVSLQLLPFEIKTLKVVFRI